MKDFEIFRSIGHLSFSIYPLKSKEWGMYYQFDPGTNKILHVENAQNYNITLTTQEKISIDKLPAPIIQHYSAINPDFLKYVSPFLHAIRFDYGGYQIT